MAADRSHSRSHCATDLHRVPSRPSVGHGDQAAGRYAPLRCCQCAVQQNPCGLCDCVRVFTNTAVSLDGRIGTVSDDHFNVGTDEDRRRMGLLRAKADAVFIGGQTFRMGPHPIVEPVKLRRPGVRRPALDLIILNGLLCQLNSLGSV